MSTNLCSYRNCCSEFGLNHLSPFFPFIGADDKKYNVDLRNATQLCAQCSGIGKNKCARSSSEPYYSYDGALKCLKDGKGDVAFIKASTVLSDSSKANYELLCLDGSTKGTFGSFGLDIFNRH